MNYTLSNIVFPAIPGTKEIDPIWLEESIIAKNSGYTILTFNIEEGRVYQDSNLPSITNLRSLYRGTPLTEAQYLKMNSVLTMLTNVDEYLAGHECYGWVDKIHRYTYPTQYQQVPFTLPFNSKQYLISLPTKSSANNSYIKSQIDIDNFVENNNVKDGEVLCVRDYIQLSNVPKQRFFCVEDDAYGYNGVVLPEELKGALKALNKRYFYSLDVAYRLDGSALIVGIEDGQVSDLKEWDLEQFYGVVITNLTSQTKKDYMVQVF